MIKAVNVSKRFDDIQAVDSISLEIKPGIVYGLIGTNGAGKSTFLRMLSGVYKPDTGSVTIDGEDVFDNPNAKKKFMYISDDAYYFSNSTPMDMCAYYKTVYEKFDEPRFEELLKRFNLDKNRKIKTFSKGMKKQLSMLLGVCAGTDYLFCDETFDGLDPVMRQAMKSILANEITERNLTPIIASHNLRELEDICDCVGLLHKGDVILSKDMDEMKGNIYKVQVVFKENTDVNEILSKLAIINRDQRGSLMTLTVRGTEDEIMDIINAYNPVFCEALTLSLEEIFISETEVIGYDIKSLIY